MPAEIRPLIAGNWKMNGNALDGAKQVGDLARRLKGLRRRFDVAICPPFPLLPVLAPRLKTARIALGAQDCHAAAKGAHTGDVSAEQLADAGCAFVIVGHSERRGGHGETDAAVRAKAEAVLRAGLTAIVCVGETRADRRRGRTLEVVGRQLRDSVPKAAAAGTLVVAYEPVWAIGSGLTPTLEQVGEVHGFVRARLTRRFGADGRAVRILYGGSVNKGNAADLLGVPEVNGALVGGASLKAADFWPILQAAQGLG